MADTASTQSPVQDVDLKAHAIKNSHFLKSHDPDTILSMAMLDPALQSHIGDCLECQQRHAELYGYNLSSLKARSDR